MDGQVNMEGLSLEDCQEIEEVDRKAREQKELGNLGEELKTKDGQVNMEGLSLDDRQEIEEVDRKAREQKELGDLKAGQVNMKGLSLKDRQEVDRKEVRIEDMPNEILVTIFENLGLTDISRCSWVNQRWKNVIESKFGTNDLVKFWIKFRNPRLGYLEKLDLRIDTVPKLEACIEVIFEKAVDEPELIPHTFDKLVSKFKDLPIDTAPKLEACIELIYEKAINQPEFSQAYACMVEVLSGMKVTTFTGQRPMNFQRMIITRCQNEFERDYMEGFDKEKYKAELAAEESGEKRKKMQFEYEEKESKARRRSVGNIRFTGELYNLKMLTDRIMREIIRRLLTQTDEESFECLCCLLNTIGEQLDQCTETKIEHLPKTLLSFDHYFGKMEGIVKDEKVPARIRALIQDVIDLRNSKWIPRREHYVTNIMKYYIKNWPF